MNYKSLEDRTLQQAFQSGHSKSPESKDCLEPENIWDAVAGKFPKETTLDMIHHTAVCPTCAENWRLARQVQHNMEENPEPVAVRNQPFRLLPWSLAAAAMLVLGLWATFSDTGAPLDGAGSGTVRAGKQITITAGIAKGMHLNRDTCLLQWTISDDYQVSEYRLRVTTSDPFDVVTDVVVQQPQYQIPAKNLERLASKTPLLWRVTATIPEIGQIHSETFTTILE